MTTQQQFDKPLIKSGKRFAFSQRLLFIVTVCTIAIAVATVWILGSLKIIPTSWASISSILIAVPGAVFTMLQAMHVFLPAEKHESPASSTHSSANGYISAVPPSSPLIPPIIVQLPATQPLSTLPPHSGMSSHRGIVGFPPPTDPRTIQQREQLVKAVYTRLIQPNITAIALTAIGGAGKSTFAALIYRYVEGQRQAQNGSFQAETLWFTIEPAVTFADLARSVKSSTLGGKAHH